MSSMEDLALLAQQFEENRGRLRDVAYRMLGSVGDAEDAVQETWLRLTRSERSGVENLRGWLTTVTARVCLDVLRSRRIRSAHAGPARIDEIPSPSRDALIADSVAAALLVVLETLTPTERVAFVLHDMFDLTFDEIGRILGRSEAATRQLASRARRRVQGTEAPEHERATREVVAAFLAASREGNLDALLAVLDPDVVVRADALAVETAASTKWGNAIVAETRGAVAVAGLFKGRGGGASPATIDGEPGAVWAVRGRARSAFVFTLVQNKIAAIDLIMEPDALAELDVDIDGV